VPTVSRYFSVSFSIRAKVSASIERGTVASSSRVVGETRASAERAVRRAAVHPGRPRPGLAEFNRYACVGAGAALGLLLLQAYAWARALPPPP